MPSSFLCALKTKPFPLLLIQKYTQYYCSHATNRYLRFVQTVHLPIQMKWRMILRKKQWSSKSYISYQKLMKYINILNNQDLFIHWCIGLSEYNILNFFYNFIKSKFEDLMLPDFCMEITAYLWSTKTTRFFHAVFGVIY